MEVKKNKKIQQIVWLDITIIPALAKYAERRKIALNQAIAEIVKKALTKGELERKIDYGYCLFCGARSKWEQKLKSGKVIETCDEHKLRQEYCDDTVSIEAKIKGFV